jgi:lipopolysaccharide transport system permease protein
LGVLNVFLRDIGQVFPIILQILFWFTPIVYSVNIIPEGLRGALIYNPLYPIVTSYQNILVYGNAPDVQHMVAALALALVLMLLGLFLFRRAVPEMVDAL